MKLRPSQPKTYNGDLLLQTTFHNTNLTNYSISLWHKVIELTHTRTLPPRASYIVLVKPIQISPLYQGLVYILVRTVNVTSHCTLLTDVTLTYLPKSPCPIHKTQDARNNVNYYLAIKNINISINCLRVRFAIFRQ